MITRLCGKLLESEVSEVVVDVQGVGFAVTVPVSTFEKLPLPGNEVVLHTHLQVREDAFVLFGFATLAERLLFRTLLGVSGIGPRLALNILSGTSVRNFCQAIVAGDAKGLARINGIGKRVAERLIVELRDKLDTLDPQSAWTDPGTATKAEKPAVQDAITGLQTLGYKQDAARKAVMKLIEELPEADQSAENLIRKALTMVNR